MQLRVLKKKGYPDLTRMIGKGVQKKARKRECLRISSQSREERKATEILGRNSQQSRGAQFQKTEWAWTANGVQRLAGLTRRKS